jgi:hypothetical protein
MDPENTGTAPSISDVFVEQDLALESESERALRLEHGVEEGNAENGEDHKTYLESGPLVNESDRTSDLNDNTLKEEPLFPDTANPAPLQKVEVSLSPCSTAEVLLKGSSSVAKFPDGNLNVSSKVLASFNDWNSSELGEALGPPRFNIPLAYSSDDEESKSGFWSPETGKYWALQYSGNSVQNRTEDSMESGVNTEGNNNSSGFVVNMEQEGKPGPGDKARNGGGDGQRPRPPQRSYARRQADRALYWVKFTSEHL